jgi:hypothetical protein
MTTIAIGEQFLRSRLHAHELIAESPPGAPDRFHGAGCPFLAIYVVEALGDSMTTEERADLAARILSEARDGAWAWGPAAGIDVDTTSAAIRALSRLGHPHPLAALERFYNPRTGLYLTFHDPGFVNAELGLQLPPQELARHRGSHPCVLGQVYLLQQERQALPRLSEEVLDRIHQPDGSWASYCYPSEYYSARFFCALIASRVDAEPWLGKYVASTAAFLLREPEGLTPTRAAERAESLGHLRALLPAEAGRIDAAMAATARALRETQDADGSWPGDVMWRFLDEDGSWVAGVDSKRIRSTSLAVKLLKALGPA